VWPVRDSSAPSPRGCDFSGWHTGPGRSLVRKDTVSPLYSENGISHHFCVSPLNNDNQCSIMSPAQLRQYQRSAAEHTLSPPNRFLALGPVPRKTQQHRTATQVTLTESMSASSSQCNAVVYDTTGPDRDAPASNVQPPVTSHHQPMTIIQDFCPFSTVSLLLG